MCRLSFLLTLACFVSICIDKSSGYFDDEPVIEPKSAVALQAKRDFNEELKKLEAEHANKFKKLSVKYVVDLEKAQKIAIEKNDVDEAQRILMAKKTHEEEEKADLVPVRGFSILHARWGAKSNWNDVTAAARKQVTKNRLTIVPEKAGFPDPIFGTFKSLVVVYSVNGKVSLSIAGWDELTDIPPTIKKR